MSYEVPHFINGQTIKKPAKKLDIYHPASGKANGYAYVADQQTVNAAVAAAVKSYDTWSQTTPLFRTKIMFRYKALLDQNIKTLAKLISDEHGKTVEEAIGSLQRGIDVVDYVCGIPNLLKGSYAEKVSQDIDCYSIHQPLGVCVGITPFNFPGMIPLWMFPMAIACGNTFVLKPSEKDPSCPLKLVELALEAGVPEGVVNAVQGDKETVDALLHHPDVKAISFVGSSQVAEYVYREATLQHKRVQAFGGAKNHCLILPDADLDQAANALVASAYGSAGERCMAVSVIVAIGDETADALVAKMTPLIKNLKIGPSNDAKTELCPLVTKAHLDRVQHYVALGKEEGAQLVVDGSQLKPANSEGFFMGGCLFDHVKPNMRIYLEEIFGPVLCVMRVKTFDEALALVNAHEYGNGTAIFTRDGYLAREFAKRAQAGMVGVNVPIPVPVAYQSFGGWKRSIFSDIGMYGSEGVRFYTKLKTITERWFSRKTT